MDVTLYTFNTLTVVANRADRMITPNPGKYWINIMNLGPGSVWLRADAPPAVSDPRSEELLPMTADNQISIDGSRGLGIIPDANGTVVVRIAG